MRNHPYEFNYAQSSRATNRPSFACRIIIRHGHCLHHENPPTWAMDEPTILGIQGSRQINYAAPSRLVLDPFIQCSSLFNNTVSENINVALISNSRAFGDGPRNFEPCSKDKAPLLTTTPTGGPFKLSMGLQLY
ncbi:hypothetical protein TNCV_4537601 [Trichonephila clavipes]|nr:hypothetical protein TNCV_4537601 [Trichonephila clavipes]